MKFLKYSVLLSFLGLMLVGCGSTQPELKSPIINNTKVLKKAEKFDSTYYYLNDDVHFKNYKHVDVSQLVISKNVQKIFEKSHNMDEIASYLKKQMNIKLNDVLKNNTGKGNLKLQISIDNVNIAYEDLKIYNYIPVSLVLNAIKRGTGIEDKQMIIVMSLKLTDEKTKENILLAIVTKKVKNVNEAKDVNKKKLQKTLDDWVLGLQKQFTVLNTKDK